MNVRKNPIIFLVAIAAVLALAVERAPSQDRGGAPAPAPAQRGGRGARPRGPAGPLPRLADGHPDLTGIWNGFGGSGNDAPNMQPWAAKVVADHRAKNGAEDFEARCLPGGPPRAAP